MTEPTGPTLVLTGTRIRERRLTLSRRQADVARAAGISPAYLNLIEHNRRPVGPDLIARLADALDVPATELAEGRQEARIAGLREALARIPQGSADPMPEGQEAEFLARFPGWAAVLLANARRAEALERQLVALSDRIRQDPYLLSGLHEVLSAVTSVRSTAAILAENDDIDEAWRTRFHANLDHDSLRLSRTAQALAAYLDGFGTDGTVLTPQEETEAWMAAGSPAPLQSPNLTSDAARAMAMTHQDRNTDDARRLPDATLQNAAARHPDDALRIAETLDLPLDLVMRRLIEVRPYGFSQAGLLICDGSGGLVLRRSVQGLVLSRPDDACAMWPLYQALALPQIVIARIIETPEGRRFRTLSFATRRQPHGADGPVLTRAQMLILPQPAGQGAGVPVVRVGPACRICPRVDCVARREPSILLPR